MMASKDDIDGPQRYFGLTTNYEHSLLSLYALNMYLYIFILQNNMFDTSYSVIYYTVIGKQILKWV